MEDLALSKDSGLQRSFYLQKEHNAVTLPSTILPRANLTQRPPPIGLIARTSPISIPISTYSIKPPTPPSHNQAPNSFLNASAPRLVLDIYFALLRKGRARLLMAILCDGRRMRGEL